MTVTRYVWALEKPLSPSLGKHEDDGVRGHEMHLAVVAAPDAMPSAVTSRRRCASGGDFHLCNGCKEARACALRKKLYFHDQADKRYHKTMTEARTGADVTDAERRRMGELIAHGLRLGQSVHHVLAANGGTPSQFPSHV